MFLSFHCHYRFFYVLRHSKFIIFEPNDNVSEPSLSRQAYHTYMFRTFVIENQVDILRFDCNKVNLHCDNVSKLSLSLQAFLCTSTFQIH